MGFFSKWFSKSQPEDYEQVLESLASDIHKRQTHLSEIRLRERRSTLLFSIYAIALWGAYVSLWWKEWLPKLTTHSWGSQYERTARGIPVFLGPIVILFIRRIVQIWYTRIGNAEEKQLIALRKQQREKIEQIKKQTNYYTTRNLLERYDETPGPTTPLQRRIAVQPPTPVAAPVTPQRSAQVQPQLPLQLPQTPAPVSANLQQRLSPSPQRPMPPPRKQWYDKLADAILGDDDASSVSAAASRYALICQRCFSHNGLVKESEWEDIRYVCPKCGHFNPSAREMRQARAAAAAASRSSQSATRSPVDGPSAPPLGKSLSRESSDDNTGRQPSQERSRSRPREEGTHEEEPTEGVSVMDVDS
ncbi:unnamed protein product [Somion occarium]|uniref:Endoplasmic reticulum junction formation protein lunapark n=1 Tax=Somion occarium TaxID=3059160 RepID=A0ABP1CT40_9APHY